MQFMTALFGGSAGTLLNAAFALGIVIVLIVLGLWLLKLLSRAGENIARKSDKRLQVIESASVDGKRKVLILRRDNVEHVIMTGGPADVVIETGIAVPETPQARRRTESRPQPAPAARQSHEADIATPITPDRPVSRDTVDRLRDLARPNPPTPRVALRHTALLRPVADADGVIPIGPELLVDNSPGLPADSARGDVGNGTGGKVGFGGRNRFFRNVARDRS